MQTVDWILSFFFFRTNRQKAFWNPHPHIQLAKGEANSIKDYKEPRKIEWMGSRTDPYKVDQVS